MARFELFSSSTSPSFRSSLFPMMLSPSPSSVRLKSCESSMPSPSGVVSLSGRISRSSVCVPVGSWGAVLHVAWVAGSHVIGSSCCPSVLVVAPLRCLGSWSFLLAASPVWSSVKGVLIRSALAAFSTASASRVLACSLRSPLLCLGSAASHLASVACFCRIILRGSGFYLSIGGIFSLPLVGGVGGFPLLLFFRGRGCSWPGCDESSSVSWNPSS